MTLLERAAHRAGPAREPEDGEIEPSVDRRWSVHRVDGLASDRRVRWLTRTVLVAFFVVVLGYLVILPLVRLQVLALEDGGAGYRRAFGAPWMGQTLRHTVGLALGSLVIALVTGTGLAWMATRLPRRMRFLRILPILPIIVPAVGAVLGWAFLFSPRPGYLNVLLRRLPWWDHLTEGPVDIYTLPWIVIITGIGLTSFVYLFVNTGLASINPELLEASHVSGSNSFGVFFKVVLPLLRPSLIYGGGVALLLGLGQFTGPLLLGRTEGISVLTTDMYLAMSETPVDHARAAAIGSPLLMFGLIIVGLQKVVLGGDHNRYVSHSGRAFRGAGRSSRLAVVGLVLYSVVAVVLPLTGLVIVSLSPSWTASIDPGSFTMDNFRAVYDGAATRSAILLSLTSSLIAIAITIPVGYVAATVLLRSQGRSRVLKALVDLLVTLPLGVPAVVFGVGFYLVYTTEPLVLYGTRWVLVLVYVTLMLPFATRMQLSGMISLGPSYSEAARSCGAGPVRSALQIQLPLLRSTLAGAGALIFVLLSHEFAASLLVRSPRVQVMGTILYDYFRDGSYPLVSAIAVVMALVTTLGVAVAVALAGSDLFEKM